MNFIPSYIEKELSEIQARIEIIRWKYLNDDDNESYREIVKKFYPDERRTDRAKLLNPWSYIWNIVYNVLTSYFWEAELESDIDTKNLFEWILSTWTLSLKLNPATNKLESVKANSYFYDGTKEWFVTIIENNQDNQSWRIRQYYTLVETFQKWILKRKLYKINNLWAFWNWEEVNLNTIEATESLVAEAKIYDNSWNILNRLVLEKKIEEPLIEMLKTIIYSIDKKIVYNDHTLMDYWEAWTILKNIDTLHAEKTLDNWDRVLDLDKLWKVITTSTWEWWWVEVIKNAYESINTSLDVMNSQFKQLSSITWIPLFFFWLESTSWNDSWTSKIKASGLLYKRIEKYRNIFKKLVSQYWDLIWLSEDKRDISFPEIVTSDLSEILDTEEKKLNNNLTSQIRSIMKVHNCSREQSEEIIYEIDEEKIKNLELLAKNTHNGIQSDTWTTSEE